MFRELFPKVLKWCMASFFMIWGINFLFMVKDQDKMWPLSFAILSFGIVYWLYKSPKDIPWQVALTSVAVVGGSALAALNIFIDAAPFNWSFSAAWSAWTMMTGIPLIAFAYWKFK